MATQPLTHPAEAERRRPGPTRARRMVRMSLFTLAGLVSVLLVALTAIYIGSQVRLNRHYDIAVQPPPIPAIAASIARGQHLATAVTGCTDCHGADLSGHTFADAPPFLLVASNLTRGAGGVGSQYSDADWVRAIRYGVRPNGKSLIFMPSKHFAKMSHEDLGAIIAFIKSVAPVDHEQEPSSLRLLGRLLLLIGEYPLPAETVDVNAPIVVAPPSGRTVDYGQYLVSIGACSECHGTRLAGAAPAEPGAPPGVNLTPGGNIGQWSEAEFINTLRTGLRPDGTAINAAMPWWVLAQQTDDELGAIYRYLRSLPALPTEGN
ncbi:MAG: cytochrome c [Caldilinea sp. CFX5]|nr:cytochrome c [Caldilinea sp. CFX5]